MVHDKSCNMVLMPLVALVLALALAPIAGEASSRGLIDQMSFETTAVPEKPSLCKAMVAIHGYKCEEIHVTTKDGYILNLQKIHAKRKFDSPVRITKKPVLLQHGLLVDAAIWLLNTDPTKDLPLILASRGHDVWLANTRGTRFSRKHTTLSDKNTRYWEWSLDELITHELPAVVGHIYNNSRHQKVNLVAHSMGTLMAMASLSGGGNDLRDQLNSVTLLSPVANFAYLQSPLATTAAKMHVGELIRNLGWAEFDPNGIPVSKLVDHLCITAGIKCYDLMAVLTGKNCCLNASTIDTFMYHEPQPTSTKTLVHLSQAIRNRNIAKFDYGLHNMARYGSSSPPGYNLSKIPNDMPMFISYGGEDLLTNAVDVKHMLEHLKNHDKGKLVVKFLKEYAHIDFVMAINAKERLYDRVIDFFFEQEL